jgi:hypothetical protein
MSERAPTVRSLLEFDFEHPPAKEINKLREYGRLTAGAFGTTSGLSNRFWLAASKNAFSALGQALDRPLTDILASGWQRYEPFLKYADTKRYPPDVAIQHELLTHTIDANLTPRVNVLLDGQKVGSIKFQLGITLELEAGTLSIQGGRFMSIRPGTCWATAHLNVEDHPLLQRKTSKLELPGEITFGAGIPILPIGAHTPVSAH